MPASVVTPNNLFTIYHDRLALKWLAGKEGADTPLIRPDFDPDELSLIGPLNLIHPYSIQVLGGSEVDYLRKLGKNSFEDALDKLFEGRSALIIICEGLTPPEAMMTRADQNRTALLGSRLASGQIIEQLDYYLNNLMAESIVMHGVFMDVMGIGVLLSGESAVGKSELALELITRGHQLIADDAPEFTRVSTNTLRGSCPEVLRDFLEVRGLGLINVRSMFGESAIKHSEELQLILHLSRVTEEQLHQLDRLKGSRQMRRVLEVDVPEFLLPVAPGRNLAVLVEAAVRNYILYNNGYDALEDFAARQQQLMTDNQR